MATYKGKACTVVRTNGKHRTIKFSATGSTMTVPASRLNKGKRKKAKKTTKRRATTKRRTTRSRTRTRRTTTRRTKRTNPWVSFEGHGRNKGRKKAGKKGRRPGVKRAAVTFFASSTRARGRYVTSSKPKGHRVVGTRKYSSKKAYTAAQKRRGKALTKHLRRNR